MKNKESLEKELENGPGYSNLQVSVEDLEGLRRLIHGSFKRNIESSDDSSLVGRLIGCELEAYHEQVTDSEHKNLWDKSARMLDETEVEAFKKLDFFLRLSQCYGSIEITDEESAGRENIYWRIVRPYKPTDIGPVHADYMFWELGTASIPEDKKRIKVWIPVYCEAGSSGLRLAPHSHKKEYQYYGEGRDGKMKPLLVLSEERLNNELKVYHSPPGKGLVFHDRLLHGGFHKGNKTRISIELTLLVEKQQDR